MKDINNKMVIAALVLAVLAVLSVIFAIGFKTKDSTQSAITSFLECETAGFPVMESSPRQCIESLVLKPIAKITLKTASTASTSAAITILLFISFILKVYTKNILSTTLYLYSLFSSSFSFLYSFR
jgi:hypothetical protein